MSQQRTRPRNLIVLGSTGTIGQLSLDVAARHPDALRVIALAAGGNAALLAEQAQRFGVAAVGLARAPSASAPLPDAMAAGGGGPEFLCGPDAAAQIARWPGGEIVLNGIVGAGGLAPSLAALDAGRRLALANKESMVMAGPLLREAIARGGGEIVPVDSEHSALFQCLLGRDRASVRRLVLTASGGPLRGLPAAALAAVTPQVALRHPAWSMGARITVDSATLFNKGMEVIEASFLFDLPLDRIAVWVHPEAIVHGLVEFCDGSLQAQLACPDMRLPIQYALSHPQRWEAVIPRCDLTQLGALTFEPPDLERFPCLGLALAAARAGGVAPAIANAADEVLVAAFLAGSIGFPDIARGLEGVLADAPATGALTLEAVLAADAWARERAGNFVGASRD
jgi:1-deoxy-D-xylulose-5-phosphate reductoisomerase